MHSKPEGQELDSTGEIAVKSYGWYFPRDRLSDDENKQCSNKSDANSNNRLILPMNPLLKECVITPTCLLNQLFQIHRLFFYI